MVKGGFLVEAASDPEEEYNPTQDCCKIPQVTDD